jgi:hypothetical protein
LPKYGKNNFRDITVSARLTIYLTCKSQYSSTKTRCYLICTNANSDGLIKCLRQRHDSFSVNPNIYALNLSAIYKILWYPDSFISRDSIFGAVGRRAGASFFARHLDYFIVTRNFATLTRTWYSYTTSP